MKSNRTYLTDQIRKKENSTKTLKTKPPYSQNNIHAACLLTTRQFHLIVLQKQVVLKIIFETAPHSFDPATQNQLTLKTLQDFFHQSMIFNFETAIHLFQECLDSQYSIKRKSLYYLLMFHSLDQTQQEVIYRLVSHNVNICGRDSSTNIFAPSDEEFLLS